MKQRQEGQDGMLNPDRQIGDVQWINGFAAPPSQKQIRRGLTPRDEEIDRAFWLRKRRQALVAGLRGERRVEKREMGREWASDRRTEGGGEREDDRVSQLMRRMERIERVKDEILAEPFNPLDPIVSRDHPCFLNVTIAAKKKWRGALFVSSLDVFTSAIMPSAHTVSLTACLVCHHLPLKPAIAAGSAVLSTVQCLHC